LQVPVVQGRPSLHAQASQWSALVVALKVPGAQMLQTASLAVVAGVLTKVPAAQMLTGVQAGALVPTLKLFAPQTTHTRSTVADGVLLTKVPAAQVAHCAQEAALGSVENCWLAQAVQLRSVVVDPSLARKVPGAQTVLATHAVAGSLSWSQVPVAQTSSGLAPPAQYSPGTHALQTVAEVALPAATCTDPAKQLPWGRQLDWLSPLEYSPVWQGRHSRSAMAEGVLPTYMPARQLVHAVHAGAF
jgi:hypothetical protein